MGESSKDSGRGSVRSLPGEFSRDSGRSSPLGLSAAAPGLDPGLLRRGVAWGSCPGLSA